MNRTLWAAAALALITVSASHRAYAKEAKDPIASAVKDTSDALSGGGGGGAWDAKFGDIPSGNVFEAEIGFPFAPRLAFHHALNSQMSVGGLFGVDYGYYAPNGGVRVALHLGLPVRLSLLKDSKLSIGLRLDPGLFLGFTGAFQFGLLLNAGVNIGYIVNPMLTVGGGIDLPLGFVFTPGFYAAIPILFGPVLELHVSPQLAILFDAKFGPWIGTGGGGGTTLGLKLLAGIAYRL